MTPRIPLFDLDSDGPMGDGWSKWGKGVVAPILLTIYGISRFIFKTAILYGTRGRSMPLTGWDAVAFGIAIIAVATFLNSRHFWPHQRRLAEYTELGQLVSIIIGVLSLGFIIVRGIALI